MPYELFGHTADLGLRIEAADLDGLFRDAAAGLFAMIAEPAGDGGGGEGAAAVAERELTLESDRLDWLLFDWLSELLYLFDSGRLLCDRFDARVEGLRLSARFRTRPMDEARDRPLHEVKAITYHGLRVERAGEGWVAELIVDI